MRKNREQRCQDNAASAPSFVCSLVPTTANTGVPNCTAAGVGVNARTDCARCCRAIICTPMHATIDARTLSGSVDGQSGRLQYQLTMKAFSSVTSEARVALHKRAQWRRPSQAHLVFSYCYCFTTSPSLCCFKIEMLSERIFDASQGCHNQSHRSAGKLHAR
jgi:hypothetical protein